MTAQMDQYAMAKKNVTDAIKAYIGTAAEVGSDDPSSTIELARQALLHSVNEAVDQHLLTVPLSRIWTHMTSRARPTDRANGAGA